MIIGGVLIFPFAASSSWIFNVVLISFAALLSGAFGYHRAKYLVADVKNDDQPRKIQFSLLRMLIATLVVALVFGLTKLLYDFSYTLEIVVSTMIALAFGGLVLICKKGDIKQIFRMIAVIFLCIIYLYAVIVFSVHKT
jgi:hypothetical protein